MPYIIEDTREMAIKCPLNAGELNYALTRLILDYSLNAELGTKIGEKVLQYVNWKGKNYQTYNDIAGVFKNIPLEVKRRGWLSYEDLYELKKELDKMYEFFYMTDVGQYEDTKIEENGDVI